RAARDDAFDLVGAGAERHLECALEDIALVALRVRSLPIMLRQYGKLADDVGQLAISRLVESERDLTVAGLLHLGYVLIVEGLARVAVFLVGKHLERPDDVVRRDRLTVVPSGVLPQAVGD